LPRPQARAGARPAGAAVRPRARRRGDRRARAGRGPGRGRRSGARERGRGVAARRCAALVGGWPVIRRTFLRGRERVDVTVRFTGSRATVTVGDKVYEFDTLALPDGGVRLVDEGGAHTAYAVPRGRGVQVRVDGATWDLEPARGKGAAATAGNGKVEAP